MASFYERIETIAAQMATLVKEKNAAYGNSFVDAGEFLKLMYPAGMKPSDYRDALLIVRVFDKLKRIATRKDAFGESPWRDIIGYGLLAAAKDDEAMEDRDRAQDAGGLL